MKIAILAVQGAFAEQEKMLEQLQADYFEIRQKKDLEQSFDGLILPGGESTVMGKLLRELDLYEALKAKIQSGLPVLGTCAGLILLAEKIEGAQQCHFGTMPIHVKRNAYGRQLGSFRTTNVFSGIGKVPMTFIRAPYITQVEQGVNVLATVQGNIVAARYRNQLGISFHPELEHDTSVHQYFVQMVKHRRENTIKGKIKENV